MRGREMSFRASEAERRGPDILLRIREKHPARPPRPEGSGGPRSETHRYGSVRPLDRSGELGWAPGGRTKRRMPRASQVASNSAPAGQSERASAGIAAMAEG